MFGWKHFSAIACISGLVTASTAESAYRQRGVLFHICNIEIRSQSIPAPRTLEQCSQLLWLPIHDHQLTPNLRFSLALVAVAVANTQCLEVETSEHTADVRVIVNTDHHPTFAAPHEIGHSLVIVERKIYAVAGGLPVRGIHVVEGVGTVVAFGAFQPGQVFDVRAGQALPSGRKVLLDPQQVNGRAGGGSTERLPGDLAGEGMVLQVEESGGALNVGEGFGAGHLLPLEHLARAQCPFELAHEFFQMVLHDAVQRDQVAVDVVEDFDRRRLRLHEVERGTAGKDFDVAFVRWEQRNEAVGQAAFAAHPRDDRCRH